MVREEMYNKIQSYRQMGYSIRKCAREADIDRKTVQKYWNMGQDEYVKYMSKCCERTKILDPYKSEITTLLETWPNITSAIIHDRLRENHENFKPSYRSISMYVSAMREALGIPNELKVRQYAEVAELPAGHQAQVDMGQKVMKNMFNKSVRIYIFAMIMSHSRKKFVCFQEQPYTARDFIEAHDLAFRYFGGRTNEIVYDQDRVMTVAENAGDLVLTEAFENYRKYAGFSIFLCRGNDPQSKGKIESTVKYVKGNFLACRIYTSISSLNSDGLAWLERTANAKIHDTTKMIPNVVFNEEIRHLKQVPTLSAPPKPRTAIVRKTNVVHYLQNRYEVPRGTYFPGREANISVDEKAGTVSFCDKETGELFATHDIAYGVIGRKIPLAKNAERFKKTKYEDLKTKVLSAFDGVYLILEYVDELIRKYPRYARDQLRIMKNCAENYDKEELQNALNYCIEKDLFSANDFRDTIMFFRTDEPKLTAENVLLPAKYQIVQAQVRSLDSYTFATGGDGL
jgi:Transposase and inactivated derivatives